MKTKGEKYVFNATIFCDFTHSNNSALQCTNQKMHIYFDMELKAAIFQLVISRDSSF